MVKIIIFTAVQHLFEDTVHVFCAHFWFLTTLQY